MEGKDLDDLQKKKDAAAPVIRMVNLIVAEAVENGASYILFEPTKNNLQIWHRVDGLLRRSMDLPKWVQDAIIARVKSMANLAIEEKRFLQIGWIGVRVRGRAFDLRVSTLPVRHGEKLIIQILDSANVPDNGNN